MCQVIEISKWLQTKYSNDSYFAVQEALNEQLNFVSRRGALSQASGDFIDSCRLWLTSYQTGRLAKWQRP